MGVYGTTVLTFFIAEMGDKHSGSVRNRKT
jgi:putative Ca2+/H+ antiporter (TMEM165/GDT1 family)